MPSSIAILIMGVSGSGKTLIGEMLAEKLGFSFADADDYHLPANKEKMNKGIPLTDEDRYPWLLSLADVMDQWLANNENGVLACSALKDAYRKILIHFPERTYIIYLKGTYELISHRLKNRKHEFMNPDLLHSQFETLEEPKDAICLDASLSPDQIVNSAYLQLTVALNRI